MTCPECRDTGVYTGFLVVEPCSRGCEPPRPWSEDDQRRQWDAYGEQAWVTMNGPVGDLDAWCPECRETTRHHRMHTEDVVQCDPCGHHHSLDEASFLRRAISQATDAKHQRDALNAWLCEQVRVSFPLMAGMSDEDVSKWMIASPWYRKCIRCEDDEWRKEYRFFFRFTGEWDLQATITYEELVRGAR